MSAEQNIQIVRDYLRGRAPEHMAEDATFHDLPQSITHRGREAIAAMFREVYVEAFSDAAPESRNWVADDDSVVLEFAFRGVNTGSFAGRPPTGRRVEVPMCVVYDIEDGIIRRARLYYDSRLMP